MRPGSVLLVSLPWARPDNWVGARAVTVRPGLVASVIRRALDEGWTPDAAGSTVSLAITENEPAEYAAPFR